MQLDVVHQLLQPAPLFGTFSYGVQQAQVLCRPSLRPFPGLCESHGTRCLSQQCMLVVMGVGKKWGRKTKSTTQPIPASSVKTNANICSQHNY